MEWSVLPAMGLPASPGQPGGGPGTAHLHAHLWVRLEIWGTLLREHVHLLQTVEAARAGVPWRRVDVSGHPFRPLSGAPELPSDAGSLLERALEHVELVVHRSPELGLVSEPDEPLEAFRSRVLAGVRPELHRRIGEGRGRAADPALLGAVSRIAGGIETRAVALDSGKVLKARLGILMVPDGVVLPAPARHDPMVDGHPSESRR